MKKLQTFILLLGLLGCRTTKPTSTMTERDSSATLERLVPRIAKVPGASTPLALIIECDRYGRPQFLGPGVRKDSAKQSYQSRNGAAFADLSLNPQTGELTGSSGCDSLKALVFDREREISRLRQSLEVRQVEVTKPAWYDIMLRWLFVVLLIVVTLLFIFKRFLP